MSIICCNALLKSFPAEPVLFLQSTEVLGRHWLPPFSGFSAGPGSVVFQSSEGLGSVGVFSCAGFARWLFRDGT